MISAISKFDDITAAGLLARAALAVMDIDNPAGEPRMQNEQAVRSDLLREIRGKLGIGLDDYSQFSLEKIIQQLDDESDRLVGGVDERKTLEKLSEKGELPSDLFDVEIIDQVKSFHKKKFSHEEALILDTVKAPDQQQHFGEPVGPGEPFLISLFAKYFQNKFPLRSFTMLVAGQRYGLQLVVHQAWRVYADQVNLEGVSDLVEMLERFSDKFGAEIEVGGRKGHFFRELSFAEGEQMPPTFSVLIAEDGKVIAGNNRHFIFTCFFQVDSQTGKYLAALALAIDISRYEKFIRSRGQ